MGRTEFRACARLLLKEGGGVGTYPVLEGLANDNFFAWARCVIPYKTLKLFLQAPEARALVDPPPRVCRWGLKQKPATTCLLGLGRALCGKPRKRLVRASVTKQKRPRDVGILLSCEWKCPTSHPITKRYDWIWKGIKITKKNLHSLCLFKSGLCVLSIGKLHKAITLCRSRVFI